MKAAKRALEEGNVNFILPYAPKKAEEELKKAFQRTVGVRKQGNGAGELADLWFYEAAVRLHREGEGAPYTGLKPAGLDWGPVIPKAERALEQGDPKPLIDFLTHTLQEALQERFERAASRKNYNENDVDAAREYVSAMLGFQLYSHHLYTNIEHGQEHGEGAEGHEH